ncbi:MAG: TIM barrel protein [Planctomycetota bacterium]
MRLGMVTYQVAAEWNIETIIQKCEATGFEGVELRTTHAHGVEIAMAQAKRQEVKKRFDDSKVRLWGLGTTCEFHAVEMAQVKKNVEEAKEFILLAVEVGAVGIKVRPNGLQEKAGIPKEKTLEQIGRAYREVGQFGKDHGIECWMEVHGKDTCLPANMKVIIDAADHDNCLVCWNSNMADRDANGKIDDNFALLKNKISSCHITELANRDYPWRRLFTLLKEAGYGDRFTLFEGKGTTDPDRFLPYYRALWRELTGDPAP